MNGRVPLFPQSCRPGCSSGSSMRVPIFDRRPGCCPEPCCEDFQLVRICNPACREEYVDVELCVDAGGCLSICVHRPPKPPCRPPKRRRSCECRELAPWFN